MMLASIALLAAAAMLLAFRRQVINATPEKPRMTAEQRAAHYERYSYVEASWGR